jgi:hypothetical protein
VVEGEVGKERLDGIEIKLKVLDGQIRKEEKM